ncbi:amidohydrolase family protein [Flavobacterium orientale]|nr:amidohydrolase family protein [Flavobacterium orientale]
MKEFMLLKNVNIARQINGVWQLEKKDIHIEDGVIVAIEDQLFCCENTQFIDGGGALLLPGFVDVHRHLWETGFKGIGMDWTLPHYLQIMLGEIAPQMTPEAVYYGTLLGALECLEMGITTVWDWSHIMNTPEHTEAAIKALKDSGIRALFGYGTPGTSVWEWFYESQKFHPEAAKIVRKNYFNGSDDLVQMALAIRGPEYSTMQVTRHDIAMGRDLELPITMHMGCGTFGEKYQGIQQLAQENLLGSDLNFAHGNYFSQQDLACIAATGGSIAITPEVEMQMGIGFPKLSKILDHSIPVGIGADVVTSCSGSMIDQLRLVMQTERAFQHAIAIAEGHQPNANKLGTDQLLELATLGGAKVMGLESKIGSIAIGKKADFILLTPDQNIQNVSGGLAGYLFSAFQPKDIKMVWVDGKLQINAGSSISFSTSDIRRKLREISSNQLACFSL